jgi:hypothetical protein
VRDELARHLFNTFDDPGFTVSSVYLQSVDIASHGYTQAAIGANINRPRPLKIPDEEADVLWNRLVARAYASMDDFVGQVLSRQSENHCLIITSDHGWKYDGTAHWNLPPGVVLLYGGPFEQGAAIEGASVYDILPTLAYLLGVPLSRELPGRVLQEGFNGDFLSQNEARFVDTYGRRRKMVRREHIENEDYLDKLKALGYIR